MAGHPHSKGECWRGMGWQVCLRMPLQMLPRVCGNVAGRAQHMGCNQVSSDRQHCAGVLHLQDTHTGQNFAEPADL